MNNIQMAPLSSGNVPPLLRQSASRNLNEVQQNNFTESTKTVSSSASLVAQGSVQNLGVADKPQASPRPTKATGEKASANTKKGLDNVQPFDQKRVSLARKIGAVLGAAGVFLLSIVAGTVVGAVMGLSQGAQSGNPHAAILCGMVGGAVGAIIGMVGGVFLAKSAYEAIIKGGK